MSKNAVIPQLLDVFRRYSYEGATVARLSEVTGLKRASLYHYFPNGKQEMADGVLEYITHGLQEQLLAPLCGDRPTIDAFLIPGGFGTRHEIYNKNIHDFIDKLPESWKLLPNSMYYILQKNAII